MKPNKKYDVTVIGAGIAGSTLGLILARQGLRVCLLDRSDHPRFALGESLLRPTTLWMRALAARYDVPELDVLAHADKISRKIAPTSGVKKCFGFLHHSPGADSIERYWWLNLPTSYAEETLEAHLFRQDIDSYLFYAAVGAGCETRTQALIEDLHIDRDGAHVSLKGGERVESRYLVDASGFGSAVARKFGLRQDPPPHKTRSRASFTHMLGVRPFDELELAPQPPRRWSDGTLHHLFDGGWVWVIPFDNHRDSTNPLCSVGVNLDLDRYPKRADVSPEQEWSQLLSQHPTLAAQFRDATPVRNWISTGRLQYASSSSVGERYCLLSQASFSVDALYSRGLLSTFQSINLAASLILDACKDGDFSAQRFKRLDDQQRSLLSLNDRVVYGSYASLRNPDLFQIWMSIYFLCERLSIAHVLLPFDQYLSTGDRDLLAFDDPTPAHCLTAFPQFDALLNRCVACMDALRDGQSSEQQTIERLEHELNAARDLDFDYDGLISLSSRLNFTAGARRYFEYESALLSMLEMLDEQVATAPGLRTSVFLSYLVRGLLKPMVRASAPTDGESFGAPLATLLQHVRLGNAKLVGVSLKGEELRENVQSVRPEVPLDERQQERLRELLDTVDVLQACVFETPPGNGSAAHESALVQARWNLASKVRSGSGGSRLSVWTRGAERGIQGILLAHETGAGKTYLVHAGGSYDRDRQVLI